MTEKLITLSDTGTAAAEAYRALRTNLIFNHPDDRMRALLVAMPAPESDAGTKAVVVANLAVTMAQSGRRTLLVDCDLRHPRQHEIWGISNDEGLSGALASGDEVQAADVGVEKLAVLAAGLRADNPADLLGSRQMEALISRLRGKAEFVLFDAPPVLAVTDAALLAAHMDGVLLVLNAGQTRRDHVERARELLERVRARVIGAVLNNAPVDASISAY
ncbi:MAG TPA: CpsD/CapB family tyrosine-protein kinase [Anaerolineales bacterium]|jgi:non-specific protein-tyrosine kinase|nr:CpsD/CapB family tyrosine-protein kinase [Anaerolineales bacterium]